MIPLWFVAVGLAILGAIWGSFVAALFVRWPRGESIMHGRSHCDACGKTLQAHELVPLLSYLIQRGKCRSCAEPIAPSNPLIEFSSTCLGLAAALLFAGYASLAAALFFWLLLPLALLDWKHLWLPDSLILSLAISGLFLGEYVSSAPLDARLIGGAAGFAALQGIRLGYRKWKGADGMGGGDPKLLGAIGLWTGWQAIPVIVMLASTLGIVWFLIVARSRYLDGIRLPLGTLLCASTCLLVMAS